MISQAANNMMRMRAGALGASNVDANSATKATNPSTPYSKISFAHVGSWNSYPVCAWKIVPGPWPSHRLLGSARAASSSRWSGAM